MTAALLWLVLVLGGAPVCQEKPDRAPGLSKCPPRYDHGVNGGKVFTYCVAACYHGKRPDGGTYGTNVSAEVAGDDEAGCKLELERQAANGCKP